MCVGIASTPELTSARVCCYQYIEYRFENAASHSVLLAGGGLPVGRSEEQYQRTLNGATHSCQLRAVMGNWQHPGWCITEEVIVLLFCFVMIEYICHPYSLVRLQL